MVALNWASRRNIFLDPSIGVNSVHAVTAEGHIPDNFSLVIEVFLPAFSDHLSVPIFFSQIEEQTVMPSLRNHEFVIKFLQIRVRQSQRQHPESFATSGFDQCTNQQFFDQS